MIKRLIMDLNIALTGQSSVSIFPTSGCCCALLAETDWAAAVSTPHVDQPLPANQRAKGPASSTTPPCLSANLWVCLISYMVCLCLTLPMNESFVLRVDDFSLLCWSQARFSDLEDCSSRMPISRQLSSHTSQRSRVRGHNTAEFERTAAHNPTDPAICLLSQITVSIYINIRLLTTY